MSPLPLADLLPSMLRADPFVTDLCAALDEVLSPVLVTLDCLADYLDVATAPEDALPRLSRWVGLGEGAGRLLDADLERALIAAAPELHRTRGTRHGIELALSAVFGVDSEVIESGASQWSATSDDPIPGSSSARARVVVRSRPERTLDADQVRAFVATFTPAHVDLVVEFDGSPTVSDVSPA